MAQYNLHIFRRFITRHNLRALPHEFVLSPRRVTKLQIGEIGKLTLNGIMFILSFTKTFVKNL